MQRGIDIFEGLLTSAVGTFRKCCDVHFTAVIGGKAEVRRTSSNCREGPKTDIGRFLC